MNIPKNVRLFKQMTLRPPTILPNYVFEQQLSELITLLSQCDEAENIVLDMKSIRHYIPAAITSILAKIDYWIESGKKVSLQNYKNNEAFTYLQRIDFFKNLGLELDEHFVRHDSPKFVPIQKVSTRIRRDDKIVESLVETFVSKSKDEDLYRLLEYALGEILRNCIQHSNGTGFVSAQYIQKRGLIRIGISDNGIGIRSSFKENNSPHYREEYDDKEILQLALKPEVSGKNHLITPYGDPVNAGVGLTMVNALSQLSFGYFYLASDRAWLYQDGKKHANVGEFPDGHRYQGVVCSLAFPEKMIYEYAKLIKDSKVSTGLLEETKEMDDDIFS